MSEIYISLIGLLSVPIGVICSYAIIRNALKPDKIIEIFDELLEGLTTDEATTKKLYVIGAIIGQGAKAGAFSGRGGKLNLKEIALQAGLGWLEKSGILGQFTQPQQATQATETATNGFNGLFK